MDFVRDDERCSSSVFLSYKMVPEDEEEAEALLPAKKAFSVLISDTDTIAGITQESIKFVNEESRMESSSAQNELQDVLSRFLCLIPLFIYLFIYYYYAYLPDYQFYYT
ncbi:hypothetical protein AXF42_Ash020752 [Apostasia shenzhenica]|uniref:Uncharacterized protein n=1 Tax=Apostasia shenzhenica TaxID=1088818 RepID=A0A2I0APM5_9ASPA|nr:hypothetical protein AXF42_Ash020752 [Apostasia shenzhenica]